MNISIIIPSRLKSERLPNKLLLLLQDKRVIDHVIERAKMVLGVEEVILSTSYLRSDSYLTKIALDNDIRYFFGDPVDVLGRITETMKYFSIDYGIVITPDNPLFSIEAAFELAKLVAETPSVEFAYHTGMPIGTTPYLIKREIAELVCEIKDMVDTEIWGPLINEDYFNVVKLPPIKGLEGSFRLTLDTPQDYKLFRVLYEKFYKGSVVNLYEVVSTLNENPEYLSIINNVKQRFIDEKTLQKIKKFYSKHSQYVRNKLRILRGASNG